MGLTVKFKKFSKNAVTPTKATDGSNGFDLTAISKRFEHDTWGNILYVEYDTAIGVTIPDGFAGIAMARSSVSKKGIALCNGSGLIDRDFSGNITFRFYEISEKCEHYRIGERIGQLLIVAAPNFELVQVEELESTQRGSGAYGHSGR